jgi:Flp pilus assembly protein TadD
MTRIERPYYPFFQTAVCKRLGVIASVTASLLLGACSQSPSLMQELTLKTDKTESTTASAAPQNELQKATIYWGQEYSKKPTELQPALNYAKNLKAMGEKQKALSVLQQASMFHGNDPQLTGEYGRLALELNQVNVAGQLLAAADDPTKPDWRVISARGTVLAKQGKYGEAIPFYERALTLAPGNASVTNNLAMAHAMMGDPKKAEQLLRTAAAAPDATPKVRENLALVLGLQGRYDESKSIASSVLDSGAAASNADYLKQMVKLEPTSEMPDVKSFTAQTSVAHVDPPRTSRRDEMVANTSPTSEAQSNWQTVSATDASMTATASLKGMTH